MSMQGGLSEMHQNARGYVQDSFQSLQEAKHCLEEALQTVEKDFNRARIEQSLYAIEQAIQRCDYTVHILEQKRKTSHHKVGSFSNGILHALLPL